MAPRHPAMSPARGLPCLRCKCKALGSASGWLGSAAGREVGGRGVFAGPPLPPESRWGGLSLGLQMPLQDLIQTGRQKPATCTQSCLLAVTPVPVPQLHGPPPRGAGPGLGPGRWMRVQTLLPHSVLTTRHTYRQSRERVGLATEGCGRGKRGRFKLQKWGKRSLRLREETRPGRFRKGPSAKAGGRGGGWGERGEQGLFRSYLLPRRSGSSGREPGSRGRGVIRRNPDSGPTGRGNPSACGPLRLQHNHCGDSLAHQ